MTSSSYNFSALLPSLLAPNLGDGMWHRCPICGWALLSHGLSALGELWVSVLTTINFPLHKETYLVRTESCSKLRVKTYIFREQIDSLLISNIIIIININIIIVGSPSGPVSSQRWVLGQICNMRHVCVRSYGVSLKFNSKAVGYFIAFMPLLHSWAYLTNTVLFGFTRLTAE